MNKIDLTRRIARATKSSRAAAADSLDQALHSVLKRWKRGEPSVWPSLVPSGKSAENSTPKFRITKGR